MARKKQEIKIGEYQFSERPYFSPGIKNGVVWSKFDAVSGTNRWDELIRDAGLLNQRLEVILRVKA